MADKGKGGTPAWLFLVRYVTGAPLDGKLRSDATFLTDGTEAEPTHWARDPWWPMLAGWKRALIRAVPLVVAWAVAAHRAAAERVSAVLLGLVLGCGIIRGIRWREERHHYRHVVKPLAIAARPIADHPPSVHPRDWVEIPQDYATNEEAVSVIHVPGEFTASERDLDDLKRAFTSRTGIEAPEVKQLLRGRDPRLEFRRSLPPPLTVGLPDVRPHFGKGGRLGIVLGLDKYGQPVIVDLDSETPHIAFTGTTGAGKSEFSKNVAVQVLMLGGIVIILDFKLVSHMWADGLPNVCYARTPQEIHEVMLWLAWDEYDEGGNVVKPSELTRRKEVVLAARRRGETPDVGAPLLIIAEERNATGRVLKRHWRRTGNRGGAPALEALDETGETGRQIDVHVEHVAQRLTGKSSSSDGSRDAIENIGAIVAKDVKEATWKLIGEGYAQPPRSGHPGRYQLITSSGVSEFQGVLYDKDPAEADRIARELAMSGTVGVPRFDMPFVNRGNLLVPAALGLPAPARQEGSEHAFVVGRDDSVLPPGEGPATAVTLAEAVAAGLFVSIAAARKVRQRQRWEPVEEDPAGGHKYALTDIYAYVNKGKR